MNAVQIKCGKCNNKIMFVNGENDLQKDIHEAFTEGWRVHHPDRCFLCPQCAPKYQELSMLIQIFDGLDVPILDEDGRRI